MAVTHQEACQYGIGSPGFSAWRELAANMIVTEGVLASETESFPLLYHWRLVPGRPPIAAEHADIDATVAALDGRPAVRDRPRSTGQRIVQPRTFLRIHPLPAAQLAA